MVMTSRSKKVVVLINTHAGEAEALRNRLYPQTKTLVTWSCGYASSISRAWAV